MAFLEDPRLRQRWNQITHDAETVTENAAAGIWSFQHNYINPCVGSIAASIEQCTAVCLGNPEERLRRRRERERARGEAEYSFDFYDDWYEDEQGGGLLGTWGGEDWDRLLAGTGSQRKHAGAEATEQPRRKRGMSYGTRGARRRGGEHDPTIIPSTQPIGFLSKLPFKLGGTLRYRPSAADLQDRPGKHDHGESEPLLGGSDDGSSDYGELRAPRQRSGTTGSGGTSDSYRSRGDIFPSDGEGEEDAVPLDDDVTYDMVRKDDRSSGRTRSSKGKRPEADEGLSGSRTVSRTTLGSTAGSSESLHQDRLLKWLPDAEHPPPPPPPSDANDEDDDEPPGQDELEEMARQKEAAALSASDQDSSDSQDAAARHGPPPGPKLEVGQQPARDPRPGPPFQAARLPSFA
ncbi:hypothetical protein CDD83_10062 [Cordyceps sp. RAO-2017]|nr:hypothetical protein CDD83_10062 [Cordyceps sp. RAO-2017]